MLKSICEAPNRESRTNDAVRLNTTLQSEQKALEWLLAPEFPHHWAGLSDCALEVRHVSRRISSVSPQYEKFLFLQSRKFRFDKSWRKQKRDCGCRQKSGTG